MSEGAGALVQCCERLARAVSGVPGMRRDTVRTVLHRGSAWPAGLEGGRCLVAMPGGCIRHTPILCVRVRVRVCSITSRQE